MTHDDELSPRARALLEAARDADDPAAGDAARIAGALGPKLAALGVAAPSLVPAAAAATTAAGMATATAGAGSAAKFVLLLVMGASVTGGMIHFAQEHGQPKRTAPASATATRHSGDTALEVAAPTPQQAPQAVIADAPVASDSATSVHAREAAPVRALRSTRTAPRRDAVAIEVPAADTAPEPVSVNAPAPVEALREEVALIERASAALRGDHAGDALRLLDEHATRFEHGLLREEQRGLRVLALCKLGPSAAALEARAAFLRDTPTSLLAPKVRAACATTGVSDPAGGEP